MLTVIATNVAELMEGKFTPNALSNLIRFSPEYRMELLSYSLFYEVRKILDEDPEQLELLEPDLTSDPFLKNNGYFIETLMDHHVKLDGIQQPISSQPACDPNKYISVDGSHGFLEGASAADIRRYTECYMRMLAKIINAVNIAKARGTYKSIIPVNEWALATRGKRFEEKAIEEMNENGWVINKVDKGFCDLCPGVRIGGRPDGYVVTSPTGEHDASMLEIKCMKMGHVNSNNVLQIRAYNMIYGVPVTLKTRDGLQRFTWGEYWSHIPAIMRRNATRLRQFLSLATFADFERIRAIIVEDKPFSF